MLSFINLFKRNNPKNTLKDVHAIRSIEKAKAEINISRREELDEDFSMEIPDDLLVEWQAYCLGNRKISLSSIESLKQAIALLEKINQQQKSDYYSLKLQKAIILAIDHYKETSIMPYEAIICTLDKEEFLSYKELEYFEKLCDEGLRNCKKLIQLGEIVFDKLNAFSKEHQKELKSIFMAGYIFSDKEDGNVQSKIGFNFCKNRIKEKKTEKEIKKICEDVTIICEHIQHNEIKDNTYNYQSLKASRDRLKKEAEKLKQLSLKLPKNPSIDGFIKNMDKTKRHIENEMAVSRLFASNHLEYIKNKITLNTIRDALKHKASFQTLSAYMAGAASFEKKLIFPKFIDKFNEAKDLDELYTLIVEGHITKSKDEEIISLNSDMSRNTGCNLCGFFGLFYKSTTHRYLKEVEKDFQKIVDDYFENSKKEMRHKHKLSS